ncbi:MAG TPA: amino acid permease [Candidatus Angelobacter sp.]
MHAPEKAPNRELVRDLNVWHAIAIVVGTIIGSGIFLVPKEMMEDVGSPGLVYLVWIVGGLLSFFGALTYAELGAVRPFAGGEYVYVRDGYGPLAGFLYAWTWFLIAKPASIASITSGLVRILGHFSSFSFLPHPLISWHVSGGRVFEVTYGHLVAILATILITALNYLGVRKAGNFQLIFTALKVLMIAGIAVVGFTASSGSWSNFGTEFLGAKGGMAGFMAALVAALWAYDGWNDLNMVSGEIRNPERSIPVALIAGVAVVAVLYMGVSAAIQYAMPAALVAHSETPGSDATQLAIGAWGAALVSVGMALSMLVTLNGTIMSGGRIPYAVARDGYFFRVLAEVHPRFHTPSLALVIQALLAIVLLLVGGAFKELFSLAIFAEWLFYMIAASTIFVFRWREPDRPRPYRTWGYPVVPALFIVAAAVLLYYTFTDNLQNSIWGSIVILTGVPTYYYFATRSKFFLIPLLAEATAFIFYIGTHNLELTTKILWSAAGTFLLSWLEYWRRRKARR